MKIEIKQGLYTGQFKKKVTLSHVYPAGYRTPFAMESPFCNMVSPGGGGPKHFPSSFTNKRGVFLTVVVYRVIVGSLVTPL
jgi:hypothetical protein